MHNAYVLTTCVLLASFLHLCMLHLCCMLAKYGCCYKFILYTFSPATTTNMEQLLQALTFPVFKLYMATVKLLNIDSQIQKKKIIIVRDNEIGSFATSNSHRNCSGYVYDTLQCRNICDSFRMKVLVKSYVLSIFLFYRALGRARGKVFHK